MLNKKILLSVLIIGLVTAVTGAGTWAQFIDTEKSTGNTLTAGSMNLKLSKDGTAYYNGISGYTLAGLYPNDKGDIGVIYARNEGSVDGNLSVTINATSIKNHENSIIDPEIPDDATSDTGELGNHLTIYANDQIIYNKGIIYTRSLGPLPDGENTTINFEYAVDNANNEIQSDQFVFDLDFTLTQGSTQTK
ncbi:SipW-dependent-type signal peptide-containing protein [Methanosarcina hadiensis]